MYSQPRPDCEHVVVLMLENRTFDNVFGRFMDKRYQSGEIERSQWDRDGKPLSEYSNKVKKYVRDFNDRAHVESTGQKNRQGIALFRQHAAHAGRPSTARSGTCPRRVRTTGVRLPRMEQGPGDRRCLLRGRDGGPRRGSCGKVPLANSLLVREASCASKRGFAPDYGRLRATVLFVGAGAPASSKEKGYGRHRALAR